MPKKEIKNSKDKTSFMKSFKAELKKVIWPTKKQLVNNTVVVVALVLATTAIVLILDLAFEALNTYGINKVKQAVQDSISAKAEENKEDTAGENNQETETGSEQNNQETNTSSEENSQATE